ncbi:hypothetical protein CW354_20585 [Marinicaulis flavus]|uniref:Uncharacterized protein n=1 Tax=Hyphococcus luteus TaxID=2058213 RepID=A0A2S7JYM6_9PROT|nr:hypothetical protein CW354_20585 [Marinicaulis flavus]
MKQGVKTPGDYNLVDMAGLALAGSAGIISALVTDYQQSGEASALFTINQWVVQLGNILGFGQVPLWMVVVGLTLLGAGSIFYFQPITRQGAFAQGFGLLAVMMTAVPSNLSGGLEAINDTLPGLEPSPSQQEASLGQARIYQASYRPAQYVQVQDSRGAKYDVYLTINFPEGLPDEVDTMVRKGSLRGRLLNEDTGETFNLFRSAGGLMRQQGNSLVIRAGVPARSNEGKLWVRVEAQGYAIEVTSYDATLGQKVDWNIDMTPSNTPLFMQRLNKSYWF